MTKDKDNHKVIKIDRKNPVLIFSDGTNFDDTIALILLLKSPHIDIKGVWVNGNDWANGGPAVNIFYNIIDWLGRKDIPVVVSSFYADKDRTQNIPPGGFVPQGQMFRRTIPINDGGLIFTDTLWGLATFLPSSQRHYVAKDTKTPDTQDEAVARRVFLSLIRQSKFPISIISLGSLTGVWEILSAAHQEGLLGKIKGLFQMGGVYQHPGNIFSIPWSSRSEFNIYLDPDAANNTIQLLSANNIPVVFHALNATDSVPIRRQFLERLREEAETPEAQFVSQLLSEVARTWFAPFNSDGILPGAFLWDPSAAIAFLCRKVITSSVNATITINTDSQVTFQLDSDPNGSAVVTYRFSNRLAEFIDDPNGAHVTILTGLNQAKVENLIIKLLNKKKNSAICPLRLPTCCYRSVSVKNFAKLSLDQLSPN